MPPKVESNEELTYQESSTTEASEDDVEVLSEDDVDVLTEDVSLSRDLVMKVNMGMNVVEIF